MYYLLFDSVPDFLEFNENLIGAVMLIKFKSSV